MCEKEVEGDESEGTKIIFIMKFSVSVAYGQKSIDLIVYYTHFSMHQQDNDGNVQAPKKSTIIYWIDTQWAFGGEDDFCEWREAGAEKMQRNVWAKVGRQKTFEHVP